MVQKDNGDLVIDLSDGRVVYLHEIWVIDEDSYPMVEVHDFETDELLGEYNGTIPDTEDEDFNMEELADLVEFAINY